MSAEVDKLRRAIAELEGALVVLHQTETDARATRLRCERIIAIVDGTFAKCHEQRRRISFLLGDANALLAKATGEPA